MNLTRKCLTALMLALIMMPAIYSIYFQLCQQLIRLEMWERIEGEVSTELVIHSSKLDWVEKGREIRVNGVMFDVKSVKKIGDSLKITGEYDHKESSLLREMELIEETQEEEDQQSNSIQVLIQVMDDSMSHYFAALIPCNLSVSKRFHTESTLPTVFLNTISPPPKS